MERITLGALPEFLVGQAQDHDAMTGCTAIVAPEGAVCGVDVRGGSPGTRDTDALNPRCSRKEVDAVLLTGGSAFGLDAAGGLMKLLEERGIGRDVGVTVVPNVCAAVIFDLKCGRSDIRPDVAMGRLAGENAFAGQPFQSGNFGAGTGASLGKANGGANSMKGGIGAAAFRQGELIVEAIFVVNCVGDIVENGEIVAGARASGGLEFADSEALIMENYARETDFFTNTVIGCIMTNAVLTKAQAARLAGRGQDAIVTAVRPAHSIYDGDTVFALASGKVKTSQDAVGILAEHAVREAILDAVRSAESWGAFLSCRERLEQLGR